MKSLSKTKHVKTKIPVGSRSTTAPPFTIPTTCKLDTMVAAARPSSLPRCQGAARHTYTHHLPSLTACQVSIKRCKTPT
eukprot:909395-Amphidinium_carterae.2